MGSTQPIGIVHAADHLTDAAARDASRRSSASGIFRRCRARSAAPRQRIVHGPTDAGGEPIDSHPSSPKPTEGGWMTTGMTGRTRTLPSTIGRTMRSDFPMGAGRGHAPSHPGRESGKPLWLFEILKKRPYFFTPRSGIAHRAAPGSCSVRIAQLSVPDGVMLTVPLEADRPFISRSGELADYSSASVFQGQQWAVGVKKPPDRPGRKKNVEAGENGVAEWSSHSPDGAAYPRSIGTRGAAMSEERRAHG